MPFFAQLFLESSSQKNRLKHQKYNPKLKKKLMEICNCAKYQSRLKMFKVNRFYSISSKKNEPKEYKRTFCVFRRDALRAHRQHTKQLLSFYKKKKTNHCFLFEKKTYQLTCLNLERTHFNYYTKKFIKTSHPAQLRTILFCYGSPSLPIRYRSMMT